MSTEHPITPPPALVERLRSEAPHGIRDAGVTRERHLIVAAYRAGADAELEACCEWVRSSDFIGLDGHDALRAIRRPKPSTLAEEALNMLTDVERFTEGDYNATQAARWGVDAELDACCEWLREAKHHGLGYEVGAMLAGRLRAARRPKPPSLAEEALAKIDAILNDPRKSTLKDEIEALGLSRRALKRLQELENNG